MTATTHPESPASSGRRCIRVNGLHSLLDVARDVCGDARLTALLQDLNPSLPGTGRLPAGTLVTCPGVAEARSFAGRMGFSIGFHPEDGNGTGPRRKWNLHQGSAPVAGRADALALAKALIARGVTPAEAGKRIARQCGLAEIELLARVDEPHIRQIAGHAEAAALYPRAVSRLVSLRSILDATTRSGGLRVLLEGLARHPEGGDIVLAACAVAPALRGVLREEAPRVVALLESARSLATLQRGALEATLRPDPRAKELRPLVDAMVDGVEPISGERVALVGLAAEGEALLRHFEMLKGAFRQAEQSLGRASLDVLRVIALGGDASRLPRPWCLLGAVCRDVARAMDANPLIARDAGLGGLVGRPSAAPQMLDHEPHITVAELQVRAAACARAADEGDAFAERLSPAICELFGLMRPPPAVDGGIPHARRARRQAAFERAVAGGRGGVQPEGVVANLQEVLERAKLVGNPAAIRLTRPQVQALEAAACALTGPMTVHRQPVSELGRALMVAAMGLDPQISQGLLRTTGREAFVAAAQKHTGRVLSAASCRIL